MSLINKAKKGNLDALSELIEQNELMLYKIAKTILYNEEDIKDAIQETLLNIYKGIKNLEKDKYFKTWITRILMNNCYTIIKKNTIKDEKQQKAEKEFNVESNNEEKLLEKIQMQKALEILDDDLKLITIMHYYSDLSVKEISKTLDIPTGTVKSRLSRARTKLYEILTTGGGTYE